MPPAFRSRQTGAHHGGRSTPTLDPRLRRSRRRLPAEPTPYVRSAPPGPIPALCDCRLPTAGGSLGVPGAGTPPGLRPYAVLCKKDYSTGGSTLGHRRPPNSVPRLFASRGPQGTIRGRLMFSYCPQDPQRKRLMLPQLASRRVRFDSDGSARRRLGERLGRVADAGQRFVRSGDLRVRWRLGRIADPHVRLGQ